MAACEADEVIAKDVPEVVSVLSQMKEKLSDIHQRIDSLITRQENGEFNTAKGISFLEVKLHLLLSYITNITYYMMTKTSGVSWEGDPAIERLVQIRTVLEKSRPIDKKLNYQIDKLIKTAATGVVGGDVDPLRFKPNPGNLVSKLDEDEDNSDESDNEQQQSKSGVYVPPKVTSMPYDEDTGKKSWRKKEEEKARKRALSSSLLQDLREEYNEGPEEWKETEISGGWKRKKEREEDEHQTRYEEDNLIRLGMKKKSKVVSERGSNSLNELTRFTDISVLTKSGAEDEDGDEMKPYKKKGGKKKPKWRKASKGKSKNDTQDE